LEPASRIGTLVGVLGSPAGRSGDRDEANRNETNRSEAMNWDRVEGNWKEFKGKVQQKWGKLTSDDLDVIEGKRMQLSGRLQQRYGVAKDEAERQIDSWLKSVN
jgi:uncharacterized protein YjbJ (UPF0337 family)